MTTATTASTESAATAAETGPGAPSGGNFVASLGHDLRSPLTAIVGFARLLQRRAQLEPKQQANLEKILIAAEQQLQLINTVVDLAKAESGTLQLQPEPGDLPALLAGISDSLRRRCEEKGLQLTTRWPALASLAEFDERRLHQVLLQLLDNALRYTDQGEVALDVGQHGERFRFSVRDTGAGIGAERLRQLLQSPAPVPDARGSGLGLPLSRILIALMGGELNATSTDQGSCFSFEILLPASGSMYQRPGSAAVSNRDGISYLLPPAKVIKTLTDLAMRGDIKGLLEQAELLAQRSDGDYAPFAQELTTLAQGFQVNKICEMLTAMKSPA
jgi:K+-sensing histidine kinase KdpD